MARLGTRAQRAGQPGEAGARTRARPALALRPRRLSATAIERWIANPYAVFAERILGLEALPGAGPAARRRAARPDRARRARPLRAAVPDRLPPDIAPRSWRSPSGAGGARPERRASPPSGRRGSTASPNGSPTPSRRGAPACARRWPRWRAPSCWQAPPAPSRSRRGPTASISAIAGLVITDYKTGNVKDLAGRRRAGARAAAAAGGGDRPRRRVHGALPAQAVTGLRYISASGGEPPGQEMPARRRRRAGSHAGTRRPRQADRRLRRRGDALSRAAAGPLQLPLRRLRPPRPRGGMVGRDDEEVVSMGLLWRPRPDASATRASRRRSAAKPTPPIRRLRLGQRQRRHRQDARADHARAAPAAGRHAARAHPGAHLHQGRRRRDVQARVRTAGRVGDGRRGELEAQARRAARPRARRRRDAAGARSCSPSPSRRPAASRCRPSTPSASACCSGSRWRPACRRASPSSTTTSATRCCSRRPTRCSPRPPAQDRRRCGRRCRRPSPMPSTTVRQRATAGPGRARPRRERPHGEDALAAIEAQLRATFGVRAGIASEDLIGELSETFAEESCCPCWRPPCAPAANATKIRRNACNRRIAAGSPSRRVEALASFFLTRQGSRARTSPPRRWRTPAAPSWSTRNARRTRFVALHGEHKGLMVVEATMALLRLGGDVLDRYTAAKARNAALDFEDLVARAAGLLPPPRRWSGCSTSSTAASTTSWSTRRRTRARCSGT